VLSGYIPLDIIGTDLDVPETLRRARQDAGLSQAALAARTRTSQTAISAYESGRKSPSVETLSRLLAATGRRLTVEQGPPREPSRQELARAARVLVDVLALAEALPTEHQHALRYPRLA
jgi:transcriptional regulator with XRE-family HTH domain